MGVVWSLAGGIGPLLGGAFTEYVSWRWNWWINLPISALSFLILCFCFHVHNPRTSFLSGVQAVDWTGILLVLGMSLMILLGLNLGGVISPWGSPKVICLVVFGFFVSIIFAVYEARIAQNPIMPIRILRKRSNIASVLVCFMHGMVRSMSTLQWIELTKKGKCVLLVFSPAVLSGRKGIHASLFWTSNRPDYSYTIHCRYCSWRTH